MSTLKISSFSHPRALEKAQTLPSTGIVQIQGKYCYLKVNDAYIHELYPLLAEHFQIEKPDYFTPPDDAGAHISIIYPEEDTLPHQEFCQHTYPFQVTSLIKAHYSHRIYYGCAVDAPALATIRRHHGLDPKPTFKQHRIVFHITVGVSTPSDR